MIWISHTRSTIHGNLYNDLRRNYDSFWDFQKLVEAVCCLAFPYLIESGKIESNKHHYWLYHMHVLLTVLSIFHFITVNDIGLFRVWSCNVWHLIWNNRSKCMKILTNYIYIYVYIYILECDADICSGEGDWTELVGGGTSLDLPVLTAPQYAAVRMGACYCFFQ